MPCQIPRSIDISANGPLLRRVLVWCNAYTMSTEIKKDSPIGQRVSTPMLTKAGVPMNADAMLKVSACWACTRFLSQTVAGIPWQLKQTSERGSVVLSQHPTNALLNRRVSREWSSFQFRETMTHWGLRWGNGYAEIEWSENGRPLALWPIHPSRVQVMRDGETQELVYAVYANSGGVVYMAAEDIFHLRGYGESPVGLSVMAYAAQSMGWAAAAQIFGASFFRQSATPSGVLQSKKKLSPEAVYNLREEFRTLYSGADSSNKVVVLDAEMEYKSISIDPEKSQFVETSQFLLDEICRWFGVPPHKIYNLLRATYSNIEHQSIEVVSDSIAPWARRFQDEADFKLLGGNRQRLFTKMDLQALVRSDMAGRMTFYQGMRNIGALNVNEIRDEEGLNGIGPDGDKYTMQSGMTTLDQIGAVTAPKPQGVSGEQVLMDIIREKMAKYDQKYAN